MDESPMNPLVAHCARSHYVKVVLVFIASVVMILGGLFSAVDAGELARRGETSMPHGIVDGFLCSQLFGFVKFPQVVQSGASSLSLLAPSVCLGGFLPGQCSPLCISVGERPGAITEFASAAQTPWAIRASAKFRDGFDLLATATTFAYDGFSHFRSPKRGWLESVVGHEPTADLLTVLDQKGFVNG